MQCIVSSAFGRIALTGSDRAVQSVRWVGCEEQVSDTAPRPGSVLSWAVRELEEYAAGSRRQFEVPIELNGVNGAFHRLVLETLLQTVGYSDTVTYGELARRCGRPAAVRAVGTAMNKNPVPILIPCHRVLAKSGLGGFGPGVQIKRSLLAHEAKFTRSALA